MNACIYAVLNKTKCEICRKETRIFQIPVICEQDSYRHTILEICNKCLTKLFVERVLSISLKGKCEKISECDCEENKN